MDYENLSKLMSHALRHEPELYELELLDGGWVGISQLLAAIRKREPAFKKVDVNDLEHVIHSSKKKRHEIKEGKIRALYGHSTSIDLGYTAIEPPEILYHGTIQDSLDKIMKGGLKPMGRQYVHLSISKEEAMRVAKRRSNDVTILKIQARRANLEGIDFYLIEGVWLSKAILPKFIIHECRN